MSTTPLDNWAVDLGDVTVIYPFVGSEKLMVVIAVVLWIAWHIWQVKFENNTYKEDIEKTRHIGKLTQGDQRRDLTPRSTCIPLEGRPNRRPFFLALRCCGVISRQPQSFPGGAKRAD